MSIRSLPVQERSVSLRKCPECGEELVPRIDTYQGITFSYLCRCEFERRMAEFARREKEEHEKRIRMLFNDAKIGKRYMDCDLSNFKERDGVKEALQVVRRYVEELDQHIREGLGLVFLGPSGTGKTHLAVAVLKAALNRGYSGLFQNAPELMYRFNATYVLHDETERDLFNALRDVDVLVIDDLGKGKWTEKVEERVYAIVNARYSELKPIIITTNLDKNGLRKFVGDAVMDRIAEACIFTELSGKSYRLERLRDAK